MESLLRVFGMVNERWGIVLQVWLGEEMVMVLEEEKEEQRTVQ